MTTMSENVSLSALCRYEKTDVGPTLMGKTIRVDDTGEFFSVKDTIAAIEGIDSAAAKQSMRRLISKGANTGFKPFKKGAKTIMGARVSAIATMCAHLKGARAKAIYARILQNGVRVFAGDVSLRSEIERNHERVDRAAADGDVLTAALKATRHAEPSDDHGECVTSSQLALRRMAQQALATDVERGNLPPAQIKNREREIRDDVASFARRNGQSGRSLCPAADVSLEPVKRVNPDDGETSGQLALSRMSRRALAIDVERGNLTPAQAEERGREIRDATARFLERMYEDRTLT